MLIEDPAYYLAANVIGEVQPRTLVMPPTTPYGHHASAEQITFKVRDGANVAQALAALERVHGKDAVLSEFVDAIPRAISWAGDVGVKLGYADKAAEDLLKNAHYNVTLKGDAYQAFVVAQNAWLARTGNQPPAQGTSATPSR